MRLIGWIGLFGIAISIVGCGTSNPIPSPTSTPSPTLVEDSITPAVTIAPSHTPQPTQAPIRTPMERRPLPATWTPTPTPTVTLTPTATITPTITLTPSPTATRTENELCEAFTFLIDYDPDYAYTPTDELTLYFGIDDPQLQIGIEATERITGESLASVLSTGGLYTMGQLELSGFPVTGTYDWVAYLLTPDEEQLCHQRGVLIIREASLFDYIPTQPATPTP
jgi:hypothetical protein